MTSRFRYIVFYKPYGVVCRFTAEGGHRTLAEFGFPGGVYSAGRLDADSEGLLLLTNDKTLSHSLIEPKYGHRRVYCVQVERVPDPRALERLRRGMVVRGRRTLPALAELMEAVDFPPRDPPIRFRKHIPTCWLRLTLTEGKNRQVRRMTAAVGHPAVRLIRIHMASLSLEGLKPGEWRDLTKKEVRILQREVSDSPVRSRRTVYHSRVPPYRRNRSSR